MEDKTHLYCETPSSSSTLELPDGLSQVVRKCIYRHDFPGVGLDLVEAPNLPPNDYEVVHIEVRPKNPIPDIATVIVPGFGHRVDNLGQSFKDLALQIVGTSNIRSMITVDGKMGGSYSHISNQPGVGKSLALVSGVEQLQREKFQRLVVVGFSNAAYDTVIGVLRMQKSFRIISGVILIAPTDNPWRISQILSEAGKPVVIDKRFGLMRIGSRGTPVTSYFFNTEDQLDWVNNTSEQIKANLIEAGNSLRASGVDVKVLWARGDMVVPQKRSRMFAVGVGVSLKEVQPPEGSLESTIHDFGNPFLREIVTNEIKDIFENQEK